MTADDGRPAADKVPEWLVTYIQDTRRLLGVGDDWHLNVKVVDHPGGDADNNAVVFPDGVYLNATLEFARDLAEGEEARRVVMHEVLHLGHVELDLIVAQIVAGLPRRERKRFRKLYRNAVERFLQRTTRAMVRHIQPLEQEGASE